MNKIYYILFILFFIFSYDVKAVSYPKHHFGIGYSMIRGGGLEYQIELNKISSLKFSFLAYYYGEEPPDDMSIYAVLGAEYQYNLFKNAKHRVFSFAAISHWHIEERDLNEYLISDLIIRERITELNRLNNIGIGLGYEYKLAKKTSIDIQTGLYYQNSFSSDTTPAFIDRNPNGQSFFGLGAGITLKFQL